MTEFIIGLVIIAAIIVVLKFRKKKTTNVEDTQATGLPLPPPPKKDSPN